MFRGGPLEVIGSFRPRIESWFSNSIRISHSNPPTENETNAQAKC